MSIEKRLEQYTLKYPQEVLLVHGEIAGEPEEIVIFKGFSSSLTRPTAFDPDVSILPPDSQILTLDRVKSPYQPDQIQYLEQGIAWAEFQERLKSLGL